MTATPGTFSGKWIPEYEGHIICGQIESPTGETLKQVQNEPISADIAFVGKDIRYVQGQVESGGNTLFYTSHVYGTNDVVAAAWNINGEPFRMNILSPFSEKLPQNLPSLKLYRNKKTTVGKEHRYTAAASHSARFIGSCHSSAILLWTSTLSELQFG